MLESIREIKGLLEKLKDERNMRWAHDLCTVSRKVHVDVWEKCLEKSYVKGTVLRLLKAAVFALKQMIKSEVSERRRHRLTEYLDNDKRRVENVEDNYLKGKLSAFAPGSKLSELRAQAS